MQRVAVLSHVKASSVPPSMSSSGVRRIAWHGGKISSNKEEALQKFYLRKLRSGDQLTTQKMKAMQGTLGVKLDSDGRKNSKKLHTAHAKVTAGGKHTVLKTGRVLGPKIDSKQKSKKQSNKNGKQQTTRQPKTVAKATQKRTENPSISLEDKLDLPLDALVGGKNKRSTNTNRR